MKKKRLLTICMLMASVCVLHAQSFETATNAVKNMGLGWNLGNTLDANNNDGKQQGLESETCWGQPYTKPELIQMMKGAGFGAIRVPVTWMNHMDANGKVDEVWMARVKEVVDYVINQGLYCIINVHHDTGDGDVHWLHASMTNYNSNKTKYEYLWKQIAEKFKDYGEKLLFESYNEMLDKYNSWCFASFNSTSKYNATDAADAYKAINSYAQSFVTTVRNTGGNNAKRNLVVNTYGACDGRGSWNSHLKDPLTEMKYPTDAAGAGHIIFQIHCYPSIVNTNSEGKITGNRTIKEIKSEIDAMITLLKNNLIAKGGPVIVGEWGTSNVDKGAGQTDYDVRRELMFQFVDYFIQQTKANGIGTFYWMGLTDRTYRTVPAFHQADLTERMVKAYCGDTSSFKYPTLDNGGNNSMTCFEGEKVLAWGNGINIANTTFAAFDNTVKLILTYSVTKSSDADIQLFYGDWKEKPSFIIEEKTYNGDYNPSGGIGSSHTSIVTFSESVFNILTQKGLIIHGDGITVTKAVLQSGTTGISHVTIPHVDNHIYSLEGQRITRPSKGIYIQHGKKYVVR